MMGVFAEFKRAMGVYIIFPTISATMVAPSMIWHVCRKLSDKRNRLEDRHASSENSEDHRGVADWLFSVCASCGVGAGAL